MTYPEALIGSLVQNSNTAFNPLFSLDVPILILSLKVIFILVLNLSLGKSFSKHSQPLVYWFRIGQKPVIIGD
jgi:hypothetical protein